VDLTFSSDALEATAEDAIQKKTGARGLRSLIEQTLLDVMYELPSMTGVSRCNIDAETIRGQKPPLLLSDCGTPVSLEATDKKTA